MRRKQKPGVIFNPLTAPVLFLAEISEQKHTSRMHKAELDITMQTAEEMDQNVRNKLVSGRMDVMRNGELL